MDRIKPCEGLDPGSIPGWDTINMKSSQSNRKFMKKLITLIALAFASIAYANGDATAAAASKPTVSQPAPVMKKAPAVQAKVNATKVEARKDKAAKAAKKASAAAVAASK